MDCKPRLLHDEPDVWHQVKLIEKMIISHNTRIFRFELHSSSQTLGLPAGQHVRILLNVDNEEVQRPYTPTSSIDQAGTFDLVIKVYFAKTHPDFPDGGKLTQALEALTIGESIRIRGPVGRFRYDGKGSFSIKPDKEAKIFKKFNFKRLGLIAGGSGITPMYMIMQAIALDADDETEVHLVFANQTEEDILLRSEIEAMVAHQPQKFSVWYTLSKPSPQPDKWQYSTGYVTEEMLRVRLPSVADDTAIFVCGNKGMHDCVETIMDKIGFVLDTNYFKY